MDPDRPIDYDVERKELCSPVPSDDSPKHRRRRSTVMKVVIATAMVNGLELFDFTVFGLFAAVVATQFFPFANAADAVLFAVGTFGAGFLFRPLGAIVIGAYADRFGRRSALLATCWMATLGTAAIVLCPPYATAGVVAPLIVALSRVLQGLAAGGEIGPAAALVMEVVPASQRGYMLGWQLVGNGLALALGALAGFALSAVLSPAQLSAWGWRVAFALGIPLLVAAYYIRRHFFDSDIVYRNLSVKRESGPVSELFRHHCGTVVRATLLTCFRTVPLYAIVFYMPTYMGHVIHKPLVTGFLASALSGLLLMVLAPLSGALVDKLPCRKPLLLVTATLSALAVYPLFLLITVVGTSTALLIGVACMTAIVAVGGCVAVVLVLEALPRPVRATGHGTSYALGTALFGSTAQFVVTGLVKWTGDPMSIAWYVAPCCLLSVGAALGFKERGIER